MTSKYVKEFEMLLRSTERECIEDLIDYIRDSGFYEAPCSTQYHSAKEGGLLEHSLNVYHLANKIATALIGSKNISVEMKNALIICGLLHDLGKVGQFDKPNYVPNLLKSGSVSDAKPFKINPELLNVDHEIRSVIIASLYIDLTEDEQFAILYHNGMYGNLKYALTGNETPLYMIIHWADMWASRVTEID